MERKLSLFERLAISAASKEFGKYINKMISTTSVFDKTTQQRSSFKAGPLRFNDIVSYTRVSEKSIHNCRTNGVVTCEMTYPRFGKRKLRWYIDNIISNDGLFAGKKLYRSHIKWASVRMWDGFGRYRGYLKKPSLSSKGVSKYIEFEVWEFRAIPNKNGSYKLQIQFYIISE